MFNVLDKYCLSIQEAAKELTPPAVLDRQRLFYLPAHCANYLQNLKVKGNTEAVNFCSTSTQQQCIERSGCEYIMLCLGTTKTLRPMLPAANGFV